jgi:hypothetical protein
MVVACARLLGRSLLDTILSPLLSFPSSIPLPSPRYTLYAHSRLTGTQLSRKVGLTYRSMASRCPFRVRSSAPVTVLAASSAFTALLVGPNLVVRCILVLLGGSLARIIRVGCVFGFLVLVRCSVLALTAAKA